jgi:GTP cyclohydrolase I
MIDVQNLKDHRNVDIQKVGIKNIRYPITVLDKANGTQNTVASINMYVNLPRHFKGTHMSRFVEVLNAHRHEINLRHFGTILEELRRVLRAESAHMQVTFPYFIEKRAPVSGAPGLMEYTCEFSGSVGATRVFAVGVTVPVTTLCPCSKEISSRGSHNQRGLVSVRVMYRRFFWIEDLIQLVEESASCDVYAVLKRPDEKYVTEKAYDNPAFVEDVVRNVALKLDADPNFQAYTVEAENFESIHNHSAYAYVEKLPNSLREAWASLEAFPKILEGLSHFRGKSLTVGS